MKYVFFYVQFNVQYACSTKTKIAFFSGLLSLLLKRYVSVLLCKSQKNYPEQEKNGVVVQMYNLEKYTQQNIYVINALLKHVISTRIK